MFVAMVRGEVWGAFTTKESALLQVRNEKDGYVVEVARGWNNSGEEKKVIDLLIPRK